MTPASTRTLDRRTEARTGPGPLCPRNGKRPRTIQRTCDDTSAGPPRRPADGQQRAALRRGGDGTRCLPEVLRRTKSPDRQRSGWRSPKSDDQEDDGRPGYPKRSRRPRDELSGPRCHATATSGGRWVTHGVGTAHAPCSPVVLHTPEMGAYSMAPCLSSDERDLQTRTCRRVLCCDSCIRQAQNVARDAVTRRLVCEAMKEVSSRDVTKCTRGRGLACSHSFC